MWRRRRKGQPVTPLQDEVLVADDNPQLAAENMDELVAVVPHQVVTATRCVTGLVGRLDELEILVRPVLQPLPLHARLEPDRLSSFGTLEREPIGGHSRLGL